ncbi:MAG: DUF2971 domain-containing protein [Pseudomonadota bacterium]|nr:DUF2971 domain-containing protein [Pseudomonadota bacterium]
MSSAYPFEMTFDGVPVRLDTSESASKWIKEEMSAWRWLYDIDQLHIDRFTDTYGRYNHLREAFDSLGAATYSARQMEHATTPQQQHELEAALAHHLSDSTDRLRMYGERFILSASGAGQTICRIAKENPLLALDATYTYLGGDSFRPPPRTLWHYTTIPALLGILRTGILWASDTRFLNDSGELKYAASLLDEMTERETFANWGLRRPAFIDADMWSAVRRSVPRNGKTLMQTSLRWAHENTNTYIACFCEDENLLSQWRGYGSRQPVAIGLGIDALHAAASDHGARIERCVYNRRMQQKMVVESLGTYLQQLWDANGDDANDRTIAAAAAKSFLPYGPMFKHPDFSEEREWRLVVERQKHDLAGVYGDFTASLAPHFHIKLPKPSGPISDPTTAIINDILVGPSPIQEATFDALSIELPKLWPGLPAPRRSLTPYAQPS